MFRKFDFDGMAFDGSKAEKMQHHDILYYYKSEISTS